MVSHGEVCPGEITLQRPSNQITATTESRADKSWREEKAGFSVTHCLLGNVGSSCNAAAVDKQNKTFLLKLQLILFQCPLNEVHIGTDFVMFQ